MVAEAQRIGSRSTEYKDLVTRVTDAAAGANGISSPVALKRYLLVILYNC